MKLIEKTIGTCLAERVAKTPDDIAIETDQNDYTWKELDQLSDYMAVRMHSYGVRAGAFAGIWSTNTPNWIIVFLALTKLGAVPVLLNTCYCARELEAVLRYSDVSFLYYGEGYKNVVYETVINSLRDSLADQIQRFIPIGRDSSRNWLKEDSYLSSEKTRKNLQNLQRLKNQVDPHDLAAILFTSGTTSMPKGVMLSHYNLVNSSLETCAHMKWGAGDKMLIAVPLFHCFGITSSLLSSIHTGFVMHLIEYYKTLTVFGRTQEYQCSLLNGVPSMFLAMMRNPEREHYDLSSLKKGIIAGSPLSAEDYMAIRRAIPGLKLHASYGQTETSPCVSIGDVEDTDEENAATAGRVIEHTSVRIADIRSGQILEPGKEGEIQVRGYNVMMGYYHMPEETREAFTGDGWLHTGDLGYLDERNFLYVTGRLKEMIIRGGENISPREIEDTIRQYHDIVEVKVIGIPAEVLQEMIVACVVVKEGKPFSEVGLQEFLAKKLAYYKLPAHILRFEALPMNASGKILLKELKEEVMERIQEKEGSVQKT